MQELILHYTDTPIMGRHSQHCHKFIGSGPWYKKRKIPGSNLRNWNCRSSIRIGGLGDSDVKNKGPIKKWLPLSDNQHFFPV